MSQGGSMPPWVSGCLSVVSSGLPILAWEQRLMALGAQPWTEPCPWWKHLSPGPASSGPTVTFSQGLPSLELQQCQGWGCVLS